MRIEHEPKLQLDDVLVGRPCMGKAPADQPSSLIDNTDFSIAVRRGKGIPIVAVQRGACGHDGNGEGTRTPVWQVFTPLQI